MNELAIAVITNYYKECRRNNRLHLFTKWCKTCDGQYWFKMAEIKDIDGILTDLQKYEAIRKKALYNRKEVKL